MAFVIACGEQQLSNHAAGGLMSAWTCCIASPTGSKLRRTAWLSSLRVIATHARFPVRKRLEIVLTSVVYRMAAFRQLLPCGYGTARHPDIMETHPGFALPCELIWLARLSSSFRTEERHKPARALLPFCGILPWQHLQRTGSAFDSCNTACAQARQCRLEHS